MLAAGLELAKVGESLNYGARDLWKVSESRVGEEGRRSEGGGEGLKIRRQLSDEERNERWTVMFTTTGFLLAFKNDGVGFLAGMLCHWAYRYWSTWEGWGLRENGRSQRGQPSTVEEEEEQLLSET